MSTKKKTLKQHARRRALERHGISLTKAVQLQIVGMIKDNKARFIGRQSLRVTGFEVEVDGKLIKVLYDRMRHCLVTVLPEGAIWKYEEEWGSEREGGGTATAPLKPGEGIPALRNY